MKTRVPLIAVAALATALLALRLKELTPAPPLQTVSEYKKPPLVSCGPDWDKLSKWLEETSMPPVAGSGNHQWKIGTGHDSAQFYFNQGINMYYSFHIIESMASFTKAIRFDSSSAMLH